MESLTPSSRREAKLTRVRLSRTRRRSWRLRKLIGRIGAAHECDADLPRASARRRRGLDRCAPSLERHERRRCLIVVPTAPDALLISATASATSSAPRRSRRQHERRLRARQFRDKTLNHRGRNAAGLRRVIDASLATERIGDRQLTAGRAGQPLISVQSSQ